jgi:dynein heavy chain
MGFPSTIKYGSRSRIRAEFLRFLRLAYLLDFIAIEAMGKMFINNIDFVKQSLCS